MKKKQRQIRMLKRSAYLFVWVVISSIKSFHWFQLRYTWLSQVLNNYSWLLLSCLTNERNILLLYPYYDSSYCGKASPMSVEFINESKAIQRKNTPDYSRGHWNFPFNLFVSLWIDFHKYMIYSSVSASLQPKADHTYQAKSYTNIVIFLYCL